MKEKSKSISLVARLIGGAVFLGVFMLNVVLFVQSSSGGLSLKGLKAYAQTGGTNNEEESGFHVTETTYTVITRVTDEPCVNHVDITRYYDCNVGGTLTSCVGGGPLLWSYNEGC